MYKSFSNDAIRGAKSDFGYIEMDPSSRYGRFKEVLGKGAMKTVYKAFDEVLAIEVAWNQVKLNDVFRSPEELQRLYSEVHLLKSLNHNSIMRFYTSWVDSDKMTFNFITEMFTSGSLREYRQKYKRVHIRAIKDWARQILEGLAYLHSHNPPVIHRDLKCDNIFINGQLGQVKIGDLGLAATLYDSKHAHSVIGTPEFMAPELYDEDYDELVDIYAFGMCVLEMLTSEYPYKECSNPAQIYKKVTSGKLPKAFYGIEDLEAQQFVGKCLENASSRPSARELLKDPFLDLLLVVEENHQLMDSSSENPTIQKLSKLNIRSSLVKNTENATDMTITGSINPEDDSIYLKVLISDKNGKSRNIYFPFDISSDTAHDVATEMVRELEINDWEPFDIAAMIDEEIGALVPTWKKPLLDSKLQEHHQSFCYDDQEDNPYEYSPSSRSSSQSTLDWTQGIKGGNFLNDYDTSSQSSLNSYKSSNLIYYSDNEDKYDSSSSTSPRTPHFIGKTNNLTRFCGERRVTLKSNRQQTHDSNKHTKLKRGESLVDIRSQLLHRSLVEEINKRHLFKTVAAIENIGFHEPTW